MLRQLIEENPGVQFRQLMRLSGLKNGVMSHYLAKLERGGAVKAVRGPRQARFFPPGVTDEEAAVIRALRKETPRSLLLALAERDGSDFAWLVRRAKKSPSTVSLHLSRLVSAGLVEARASKPRKRYHIKARDLVDKLIEDHRPGPLERPASGFEDVINSL